MNNHITKKCSFCGVTKAVEKFHRDQKNADGYKAKCKQCRLEQEAKRRRQKGIPVATRVVNGDVKLCASCKKWKPATSEYYYRDCRDPSGYGCYCKQCAAIKSSGYYQNHKGERRKQHSIYYQTHKSALLQKNKLWVRLNPQRANYHFKMGRLRRRIRENDLPHSFTQDEWSNALEYFGGCCAVCGRPLTGLFHTAAADHWIPITNPDCPGTIVTNIVPLCHGIDGCNNSKCNKNPNEWLISKFGKRKASQIIRRIVAYFDIVKG